MSGHVKETHHLTPWEKCRLFASIVEGAKLPELRFSGMLDPKRAPSFTVARIGDVLRFDVDNTSDHPATVEVVVFD